MSEPQTLDGLAVWRIARRPGLLRRAGLDGAVAGLDWPAALAGATAAGVEPAVADYLFEVVERALLKAILESDNGE